MDDNLSFAIEMEQEKDFEFKVRFDGLAVEPLLMDEPPPLGRSAGPNASRLIGAAVANCLSSSLLFCMRKFKQTPGKLRAEVRGVMARNDKGRMRIGRFDVTIHLADEAGDIQHFDRCLAQFEDFCVVTESVRHGIPVDVRVVDKHGKALFTGGMPG